MIITEASIKISREHGKAIAISVSMPIWLKRSDSGHLKIELPFLGIKTVAKDEADSDKAIEEAIVGFCIVAERFGQGVEKELIPLGWKQLSEYDTETLNLTVESTDNLIERVFQTSNPYLNKNLAIA